MNAEKPNECTRQFLEEAIKAHPSDPEGTLISVHRYAAERDSVELSSEQKIIIQCRMGGCSVTLSRPEDTLIVSAPDCPRR